LSTVGTISAAIESFAPASLAEEWDNTGLLLGGTTWPAERVLLAIDLTMPVVEEAIAGEAGMIIAYHPPIFRAIRQLTDSTPRQRAVLAAARAGVALYSPHTALDACIGGVNDWLAEGVGQGDRRALRAAAVQPATEAVKVVVYCPVEAVERVRNGLAAVGAGRIGNYEQCSFELEGFGTFRGNERAHPAVGAAGRLERVGEVRLEMVCPEVSLPRAMEIVRELHPYEEPAIELYRLLPRPRRASGLGRRVTLDQPVMIGDLLWRLRDHLDAATNAFSVATPGNHESTVRTIGLCAGSGGALLEDALAQGCDAFITGEMSHHETLAAVERGCTVILAGHTRTERGYLPRLRDRLQTIVPATTFTVATADTEVCEPG